MNKYYSIFIFEFKLPQLKFLIILYIHNDTNQTTIALDGKQIFIFSRNLQSSFEIQQFLTRSI